MNSYKYSFLFFIDDLNVNYKSRNNTNDSSSNMELLREIFETQQLYSNEDHSYINLSNMNFIMTCTNPTLSDSFLAINQRLSKHVINVHLNYDAASLTDSIFSNTIKNWLEEFPTNVMKYPFETSRVSQNIYLKITIIQN
jgi:hypothetical protein